ncbi:MAG TPA: LamG-like jellyroll fold domain-containing protein [Thermodesulfobacteriota bacterium]|nr:LamG-like jellyroll fold domain-containing protein [Thermodesulfobacteriota bacterium]
MYTNVVGLSGDRKFVQALQFDANSMPTGVYPYEVEIRNNYSSTTRSSFEIGEVLVNNLVNSIYGSGWSLRDLSRLYVQEDGSILIDEGDGSLLHFKARTSTLTPPIAVGEDVGSALKFDGFNDYVTFPSGTGNMMKVLPLTVEAWVRPEVRVEDPAIPSASDYGVNHSTVVNNVTVTSGLGTVIERGHGIGVNIFGRDSTITITRLPGSGYAQRKYITNPQLLPDTWYHVAVVYTSGNHKTYLNGELIDDSSYTQGNLSGASSLFRIGRIQHSLLSPFSLGHHRGDIDEVRIWQAERTQQEIQNTMSVQLTGNESGLVFYANFDEGQGQVLNDLTGGNNGILGNKTLVSDNDPTWITYKPYNRDTDGDFITPPGDYSILFQNPDGTFTRKMKDGTVINFNAQGLQTSVVDRNGNTTTYQYDGQNRLTSITDPVGKITTLTYTGDKLSSVTDPAGRTTIFEHDGAGNLIKITDPDGTFRQFSYDSNHRMTSQTSKRGHITTYQKHTRGQVSTFDIVGREI